MDFIQPLALQTWFVQILSGNPEIFSAISFIVIASMSAYFRMNGISMFFMLGLFLLMFSGIIGQNLLILFAIVGGLLISYWISRIVK